MKRFVILALALLCALPAFSQSRFKIASGPWVTNVTEDGFTVLWTTKEKSLCWLEVLPDDGNNFYADVRNRICQTVAGRRVYGRFHKIRVSGLKPGTGYRYRIAGKNLVSEKPYHAMSFGSCESVWSNNDPVVHTLDRNAKTCRFTVLNDMHKKNDRYAALLKDKKASDMDFLVLNGDFIYQSEHKDSIIKYSFTAVPELLKSVPVVFARGNHEGRGPAFDELPEIFPTPTGEFYYTFRQGPAAFIVLDGGEDKPDDDVEYSGTAAYDDYRAAELEWLKSAMKDPSVSEAPVKIVIMHIPPSNAPRAWYTERCLHRDFLPVLNEAGVDLMLSGHLHKYVWHEIGSCGNNFPILVNSNEDRMDVEVDGKQIIARIFDVDGKELHVHKLRVK